MIDGYIMLKPGALEYVRGKLRYNTAYFTYGAGADITGGTFFVIIDDDGDAIAVPGEYVTRYRSTS
jgi:hypothetical protein